jgi:hypothetical protein
MAALIGYLAATMYAAYGRLDLVPVNVASH